MRWRWIRHSAYRFFTIVESVAAIVSVSAAAALRADPKQLRGTWALFAPWLFWVQNRAWILIVAATLSLVVAGVFRRVVGPPWVWAAIHRQLDLFQEYAFSDQVGDMLHDHRVTLFKHVRWRWCLKKWPWSGWLVPVERSGHTTRRTSAAFRAPDDANRAEGVAGAAWASRSAVPVVDLPDLSGAPTADNLRAYADRTFVPIEWVEDYRRRGRPLAQSFVGIPVEVTGKRWGVLVLDSKREVRSTQTTLKLYTLIARSLATLLERT